MSEETTVTVETEPSEDTPEVIDTGDTIVVTPPAVETDNDDTDRWVDVNRRLDALVATVESLAGAVTQVATTAVVAAETAEEAVETVDQAIEDETFTEDEIVPEESHPWFRPIREWRGNR